MVEGYRRATLRVKGLGLRVKGLRFRVQGVSVRGCAGAGSTQARTPTCMSPPPLAPHACLDL